MGRPDALALPVIVGQVAVFRLYIEGRSLFVRVRVHSSLRGMRERSRELHGAGLSEDVVGRRTRGYCLDWRRWTVTTERARRDQCVAEVNLARNWLGMEVVTHELFHATMAWARRVDFPIGRLVDEDAVNDDEERIAYVHGSLCRDFVDRAYAAGLYG